jgi:hypothetical protein
VASQGLPNPIWRELPWDCQSRHGGVEDMCVFVCFFLSGNDGSLYLRAAARHERGLVRFPGVASLPLSCGSSWGLCAACAWFYHPFWVLLFVLQSVAVASRLGGGGS